MSANVELPRDWDVRVREALRDSPRPELAAGELRALGAGMDSVALLLEFDGGEYVIRCPMGEDGAEGIAREAAVLPELAGALTLPIPGFRYTAANPLGPGTYCLYPAVPGQSLSAEQWRVRGLPEVDEIARQIAEFIDETHAFPAHRAERLGVEVRDMREDYAEDLELVVADVAPRLDPAVSGALLRAWGEYLSDDANFDYRPVLIHADVSTDHLLVTGERITGVIDFGDLQIGDPDYDLLYLWTELGPEFVRRVQKYRGLPLDARLVAKLHFWQRADSAIDVLHGLEHDLPEFTEHSLRQLTELLYLD